jgi:hypothetical protein
MFENAHDDFRVCDSLGVTLGSIPSNGIRARQPIQFQSRRDYGEFEERLFRHIMAARDVSEETGCTFSAAAIALYQRIGDVTQPNPLTDTIDFVSLTGALRTILLDSFADRLDQVALRDALLPGPRHLIACVTNPTLTGATSTHSRR